MTTDATALRASRRPLITVVIPAYNAESYVRDAIASVLDQTWTEVEIVVVDDGSTDNTAEAVRAFGSAVRYVRQENAGVAAARNRGIAEARGEYVAVLDADDAWLPAKLEVQVSVLTSDPDVVAVGCGAHVTTEDLQVTETLTPATASYEDLLLLRGNGGLDGSGVMMRTNKARTLGGYDPALSTSADLDMALRLSAVGKTRTVATPLFLYRQHGSNMHASVRLMERDMALLLRKARDSGPPIARRLHGTAMSRLYEVLAGSYWVAGDRRAGLRCALAAVWYNPMRAPQVMARAASRLGSRLLLAHRKRG